MTNLYPALISASEAIKRLQKNDAKFVDASMGGAPDVTIANAVYFDIDDICDPNHPQPHMIPSAEIFAEKVSALGISNDDELIIFDSRGMAFAAARVWWLFRLFGHEKVSILNGGMPAFIDAGGTETDINTNPESSIFSATYNKELVKKIEEIKSNITEQNFQLIDARDAQRFSGAIKDPIHNVPSGHIPQSCNLFFMDLIDQSTGCLHTTDILKAKIDALNLDMTRPIAATCGSGVTACILALAFYQIGYPDIAIYDGSWSEWSISGEEIETS